MRDSERRGFLRKRVLSAMANVPGKWPVTGAFPLKPVARQGKSFGKRDIDFICAPHGQQASICPLQPTSAR